MNAFDQIKNQVRMLKPGQAISVSSCILRMAGGWTVPEKVLENIVGSGYEYYFIANEYYEHVNFYRLDCPVDDPFRTYVSPDRLYLFDKLRNGLYQRNDQPFVPNNASLQFLKGF